MIWPIVIDAARSVIGWCELRQDFRRIRLDRSTTADFPGDRYPARPAALRAQWLK